MDTDTENPEEEQKTTDTASDTAVLPDPKEAPIDTGGETISPPDTSAEVSPDSSLPVQPMPTTPQLLVALGAVVLLFALSYVPIGRGGGNEAGPIVAQRREEKKEILAIEYFKDVSITANAAYVWDVKNQKALYNKNAGAQLPLASLTKLMTALVAYEYLDGEARIPITQQALLEEGDSNLSSGETFTLRDLANLTLITSSNDGAYALAAATGAVLTPNQNFADAFIDAMNAKAEEIGLSQSYFTNPTGLDVDGATSGSYGSARDVAFLMEYLALKRPQILEGTKEATSVIYDQEGALFRAVNTNEIASRIPGLIGSKTGFTQLAGGNLVIAYDAGLNRPIVIAVLGSTREGRFSDVMTLIKETGRAIAGE